MLMKELQFPGLKEMHWTDSTGIAKKISPSDLKYLLQKELR